MNPEQVTISLDEYEELLMKARIVKALDIAGVSYWDTYAEVFGDDDEEDYVV